MYRSKFEPYPFLHENQNDLRCDFEIFTDEVTSKIGQLYGMTIEENLRKDLVFVGEVTYHLNPTLRTHLSLDKSFLDKINEKIAWLKGETQGRCEIFVLPFGSERAGLAHIVRNNFKGLVRMAYAHVENGNSVEDLLFDFLGTLSNYFFLLALYFNKLDGISEIPFESKNYSIKK